MLKMLFQTEDDKVLTILRLVLAVVFLAHGSQKMLGCLEATASKRQWGSSPRLCISPQPRFSRYLRGILRRPGLLLGLLSRVAAFGSP